MTIGEDRGMIVVPNPTSSTMGNMVEATIFKARAVIEHHGE